MRRSVTLLCVSLMIVLAIAASGDAQTTGGLSGRVTDPSGLGVVDVVVTLTGPPLPNVARTIRSDASGTYQFKDLAPGVYRVSFEFQGFEPQTRDVSIGDAAQLPLDIRLEIAAIPQTVKVTHDLEDNEMPRDVRPGEVTWPADALDRLPIGRSPEEVALMTPGVTATGPGGALTMAGAFSYGNLFLVDGMVANDSTRGQARGFYIGEAVKETRVAAGAVPAEFGRFQGGVVQTITRSGGNTFSVSGRVGLTNDSWRALTPYKGDQTLNHRVPTWEAVVGGPVVRNRIYLLVAAMAAHSEQSRTLAYTRGNYPYGEDDRKYQVKGTWTPSRAHTIRATYFRVDSSRQGVNAGSVMDRASLYDNESPESLSGLTYNAVVSERWLLEARYSQRRLTYSGFGSSDTGLGGGTPIWDRSRSDARFNSPAGCAVCPDAADTRNNQDVAAKLWFSLPTSRRGVHDVTVGFDLFRETRYTNAYQSGSGFRVRATRSIIQGDQVYPVFLPDRTTWIYWTPIPKNSAGNDLRTYSAYVSDAWRLSPRMTVKAGLRVDLNDDHDSLGARAVNDLAASPRLGVTWDPAGTGTWQLSAGWARYLTAINTNVADAASAGGRPATYVYDYLGPAVNPTASATLTPSHVALQTLFAWFLASPGVGRATRSAPSIPSVNVRMDPDVGPLDTREAMVGVSRQLGRRGFVRVEGMYRRFLNFYATRRDRGTGKIVDPIAGTNDLVLITNADTDVSRSYKGLLTQFSVRATARIQASASYTLASTRGNVDGDDASTGPSMVTLTDYPEYRRVSWSAPDGPLASDQTHRLRLWTTWDLPVSSRVGRLTMALVQRVETGSPWSGVANINPKAYVVNPGYVSPPTSVPYYFTPRGEFRTDTLTATDISVNWSRRLPHLRKGQWFFRGILTNVFNQSAALRVNRTVLTRNDSVAFQGFNPFVDTPIRGVHYDYGPDFGKPINPTDYQSPREFSISLGIRY
ncbi:MAG TPA: TonB-dependent receptor [Vicinamibacterales bacterium]|jgi:hypothetical protein